MIGCDVPGCARPHDRHGYCGMHALRWARQGPVAPRGGKTSIHTYEHPYELVAAESAPVGDCVLWTGAVNSHGYGKVTRRYVPVHQAAYEFHRGPVPPGMVIDHTCHNGSGCPGGPECLHRRCVEVAHMELVTSGENVLRGEGISARNARKTHCPRGHLYDEANTYRTPGAPQKRRCRACREVN